jgi:hypothetical protein
MKYGRILAVLCLVASATAILACAVKAAESPTWRTVGEAEEIRLAASEDAKFSHSGGAVQLDGGSIFIEVDEPTTVKTPLASYHMKRRALAFFRVKPDTERCFDFLENVTVHYDKHTFALRPGEEAILAKKEPSYADILVDDDIGRRRVRLHKLAHDKGIALTEFSLVQAIEREPLIFPLVHSKEAKDKALKNRLLKMAAVLNMVTSRHGHYSSR